MFTEDKENLILKNKNLIYYVLRKYNNIHNEDLFQTGMVGLVKAANLFDESRNIAFSSFAYICISNEILIHFRKQYRKSLNNSVNTVSYNALINEDDGNCTLEDCLGYTPDFDAEINKKELYDNIEKLLSPLEKTILTSFYGLYNTIPKKQIDLSKQLNMSQANVSRIIRRAKEKLRTAMEG